VSEGARRQPYLADPDFRLYLGDVREVLAELEPESVDCVVTSPPYWGLRDYGTASWEGGDPGCDHGAQRLERRQSGAQPTLDGGIPGSLRDKPRTTCVLCGASRVDRQIGLEQTPDAFVASIVELGRQLRRVLADHGTFWLNLGDSYATSSGGGNPAGSSDGQVSRGDRPVERRLRGRLKPKDLVGIPWRVALALQDDGWWLRADVIWSKPNPMPSSVTDRPTVAHEYVFMLTKRARYFFDQDAAREPYLTSRPPGSAIAETGHYGTGNGNGGLSSELAAVKDRLEAERRAGQVPIDGLEGEPPARRAGLEGGAYAPPGQPPHGNARGPDGRRQTKVVGKSKSEQYRDGERWPNEDGRNIRSVWEIATQPYDGAHFATYPEALVRRCLQASCPERVCRTCGQPSVRIAEVSYENPGNRTTNEPRSQERKHLEHGTAGYAQRLERRSTTLGWSDCGHDDWRPGTVLDPFMGSGTTALVARKLGRHAVGVELNQDYADLCAERLQQQSLFAEEPTA
jgi:DNA modification methylase